MQPNPASPHRFSKLALRLGLYAVALAGIAAPLSSAHADIVSFNAPISVPNNGDGLYLNFQSGATGSSAAAVPGWDFNPYTTSGTIAFFWGGVDNPDSAGVASNTAGPYLNLATGAVVSSASTFARSAQLVATAAFQGAGTHILGFSFLNETTSAVNYGYATLTSGGALGVPLTIDRWSFENNGGPITVSAVPEPSTGLMLALGALALGALKLRRRSAR
ncbi:MAG: PEP-CTERM sorting domain-containing protein [Pseudomonadota bacterium]|nr:PEP-CTERM sorting domain-containing protein [Pseudomonadota bacterium]